MDDTIGFVGTGRMGAGMAHRLLDAGRRVVVHDVRDDALAPLRARGAVCVASAREVTAPQLVPAVLPPIAAFASARSTSAVAPASPSEASRAGAMVATRALSVTGLARRSSAMSLL